MCVCTKIVRASVCVFLCLFFFFFYFSSEAEINNNTCNSNKPWIHSTVRHTLLKTCLKYPHISCYGTHHPLKLHEQGSRAPPAPHLQARKTDLLLTESRGTLRFAWMAQPYYLFIFSAQPARPLSPTGRLSQFLGRLHLLLGDLLLRHDGHPWRYWPGDGLLSDVVVVDEGEEAPAAPRALRGVAAVQSGRHAATLLLRREQEPGYTVIVWSERNNA